MSSDISFTKNIVILDKISTHEIFDHEIEKRIDNDTGNAYISLYTTQQNGYTGKTTLVTLYFKAIANGKAYFKFVNPIVAYRGINTLRDTVAVGQRDGATALPLAQANPSEKTTANHPTSLNLWIVIVSLILIC